MSNEYMYSDIDINLERQTDGDVKKDTNIEAIKNSINNIFSTMQGSRRMLPEFAGMFHNLLFEPMDEVTARLLAERMIEAINMWDDRVIVEGLDIEMDHDNNQYNCTMSFKIQETNETEVIEYVLKQT
uniref:Putative baseplate wedge subunit n=1 Tax=viral metagenome TaxID=1070528 RepID=A0A6M3K799_9ZZZZ